MSDYFGPAGIFSTDNAEADQTQIMAEEWDGEEEYLAGGWGLEPDEYPTELENDEYPKYVRICCGCESCTLWHLEEIADTLVSEQSAVWLEDHAATGCEGELIIGTF